MSAKHQIDLLCHFALTNENAWWSKSWRLALPRGKSNVLHLCCSTFSLIQIKLLWILRVRCPKPTPSPSLNHSTSLSALPRHIVLLCHLFPFQNFCFSTPPLLPLLFFLFFLLFSWANLACLLRTNLPFLPLPFLNFWRASYQLPLRLPTSTSWPAAPGHLQQGSLERASLTLVKGRHRPFPSHSSDLPLLSAALWRKKARLNSQRRATERIEAAALCRCLQRATETQMKFKQKPET